MISLAVICVLLAGQPLQEPPPAGLHFVIERDFIYMASTNTMNTEQWIAGDRMYQKRGNRVVITRKENKDELVFRMELKEETSQSEKLKEEIEKSIREVMKLRGDVLFVQKGTIPEGAKKIEDQRSWD